MDAARFKVVEGESDAAFIQRSGTQYWNHRPFVESEQGKHLGVLRNVAAGSVFGEAVAFVDPVGVSDRLFETRRLFLPERGLPGAPETLF